MLILGLNMFHADASAAIVREGSQNRNVTEVITGSSTRGIARQIIDAAGHPPLVKIVSREETTTETSQVERRPVQFRGALHPKSRTYCVTALRKR